MSLYKISDIEKTYPNWYDPMHQLSRDDQQFIWENTPLYEAKQTSTSNTLENANDLNVSVNGSCKSFVNWALNLNKSEVLQELKRTNNQTPPIEIASLLRRIFIQWQSEEEHWSWIAQRYTARSIIWQILDTIKQCIRGAIRKTPPAYFTYRIKHRKRRRDAK